MRHVIKGFVFGTALWLISATVGAAQGSGTPVELCPVDEIVQGSTLADLIDCMADGMITVWEEDIAAAAALAGYDFDGVPLVHDDTCVWRPEVVVRDGQTIVRYAKTLLYYSLYLQQAHQLYLLGVDPVAESEVVFSYFDKELLPTLRADASNCNRGGPQPRGAPSTQPASILHGRMTAEQYATVVDSLRATPGVKELGNYVGGLPVFFALLHEGGHAVLHSGPPSGEERQEREADQVAVDIFEINDVPVTLGLGHFEIFYANNRAQENRAVACRLADLAEQHSAPPSFAKKHGEEVAARLERLRLSYIDLYRGRCEG